MQSPSRTHSQFACSTQKNGRRSSSNVAQRAAAERGEPGDEAHADGVEPLARRLEQARQRERERGAGFDRLQQQREVGGRLGGHGQVAGGAVAGCADVGAAPPADNAPVPTASNPTLADFDYALPPELIARHPAAERSGSAAARRRGAAPVDRVFAELPWRCSHPATCWFSTTLASSRLASSAARRAAAAWWSCSSNASCRPGSPRAAAREQTPRLAPVLRLADAFDAEVLGRGGADGSMFRLRFPGRRARRAARGHGHVPLPPHIAHADAGDDAARH